MAEELRNKAKGKQPISRHPLFPATVALWFGSLFGLASMAIKPSLVEQAVLATHIDLIIPSAQPPLGVTVRILLALAMALAGGIAGALLARRIARPKPEIRERKRDATAVAGIGQRRGSFVAASAGEQGAAGPESPAGLRRRSLAIADNSPNTYQDRAPVPGGMPHILNVADFDLEGFEHDPTSPEGFGDETKGWDSVVTRAVESPATPREPDAADDFDWDQVGGSLDGTGGRAAPKNAQIFSDISEDEDETDDGTSQDAPAAFAAAGEETYAAPFLQPESTNLHGFANPDEAFGPDDDAPDSGDDDGYEEDAEAPFAVPGNTIRVVASGPAGNSNGHFETSPGASGPRPGFALFDTAAPAREEPTDRAFAAEQIDADQPQAGDRAAVPQESVSTSKADDEPLEPVGELREVESGDQSAAERIAGAELDELSQVELLERLALTMARRRSQREEAERLAQTDLAATPDSDPEPVNPGEPAGELANLDLVEAEAEEASTMVALPRLAAVAPHSVTTTAAEDREEPVAPAPVTTASQAVEPQEPAPRAAPAPAEIPAALRPVGIDADDDSDHLPDFVPPRRFTLPGLDAAATSRFTEMADSGASDAPARFGQMPVLDNDEDEEDDEIDEEARTLEQGYSSLLSLSRPAPERSSFVRIEEPEDFSADIQPVVIFPGEENREAGPFGRPTAVAMSDDRPHVAVAPDARHFDPPAAAEAAAPATDGPARQRDPEETERALRAALATLQRMSGAA